MARTRDEALKDINAVLTLHGHSTTILFYQGAGPWSVYRLLYDDLTANFTFVHWNVSTNKQLRQDGIDSTKIGSIEGNVIEYMNVTLLPRIQKTLGIVFTDGGLRWTTNPTLVDRPRPRARIDYRAFNDKGLGEV